jgi:hypothetical protein
MKSLPNVPTHIRRHIKTWSKYYSVEQKECEDKNLLRMHPTIHPVWIGCRAVPPHNDVDFFEDKFFLNLTISSNDHVFGDARYSIKNKNDSNPEGFRVPVGTIFKTDPRIIHWLFNERYPSKEIWIGVQWEIPRGSWKKDSKIIIDNLINTYEGVQIRNLNY